MNEPRPIGTKFTHVFPASYFGSKNCPSRHTFKVVAHTERTDGFGHNYLAEELKCVKVEDLPEPEFVPWSAYRSMHHYIVWQQEYADSFKE